MRFCAIAVSAALAATPALAQSRVYDGAEVEALLCAYVVSHAANRRAAQGLMSDAERQASLDWAMGVMDRYASGTDGEKMQALLALGRRDEAARAVVDFEASQRRCLRRFPV
jgi:hypothetical protein